jgi:acyl-CoA reductase-like NAD-dependent aldehyde dehydrogenase
VEKDADIEITARRIAWGKWMNCGQTCLAPDYVMTTVDLKPKLVAALKQTLFEFYGAEPKTSSDYSRIINERHFE